MKQDKLSEKLKEKLDSKSLEALYLLVDLYNKEKEILPQLIEKERYILLHRFMGKNLEEVAELFNITKERARQLEKRALKKLK